MRGVLRGRRQKKDKTYRAEIWIGRERARGYRRRRCRLNLFPIGRPGVRDTLHPGDDDSDPGRDAAISGFGDSAVRDRSPR